MIRPEHKWQVLLVVCIGIFMSTLDGSILNIANPTIAKYFDIPMHLVQWVVTAYMLTITATLLLFGRLGDQISNEKIYASGFLIFVIGSILCGIAPSITLLIIFRIVQAFGASMLMATGMGIVSNTFPDHERGQALGITGAVVGLGNMTGPGLGGLLLAHYNWHIIFWINVPVGLIGIFLAQKCFTFTTSSAPNDGYNIKGNILFALSVIMLLLSLGHQNTSLLLLIAAVLIFIVFYYTDRQASPSMIDYDLFRSKPFVRGNLMASIVYLTQQSVFFLFPFFLEKMMHYTPAMSGALMTILPVAMALTAPLAGTLSDRVGSRRILIISFLLQASAYLLFSQLDLNSSRTYCCLALILLGIGMGMFGSPNNSTIFASVPKEKAGYTGGFIATVRNLSFALGVTGSVGLFRLIYSHTAAHTNPTTAYLQASNRVYLIAAGFAILGLIMAVIRSSTEKNSPSTT